MGRQCVEKGEENPEEKEVPMTPAKERGRKSD